MAAWNPRANEIFADAIELTSAQERQQYLSRACDGDSQLRQLVEALLAAHHRAGSFLGDPAARDLGCTHSHVDVVQPIAALSGPTEDIGTRVGPYRLLQKLGEGGMGSVWVAEQAEPVRRRVALKLVKPGMDSERVVARFEAERQALALMDHTNIAKVFDAGTTETGRPYFAMELVKGVPITTYCDELHLSIRERLGLFVDVCRAVQHAHQKGVIHRDIKPNNVLVAIQDGKPVPKVIDFGVAKALHTRLAERTLYTEIGAVIGTLEYMAPEQAELSALDVDTRADVYALGALLYELLTGTTPIGRDRLKTAGFAEVLRLIREEEPPRPSTRLSRSGEAIAGLAVKRRTEPRRLGAEVRGELDWIVMKCLEKDRTRRYEAASGLAKDVERFLADEPVEACPPGAVYRFRKWARRNKVVAVAASLILFTLLAGVMGTTFGLLEARQQRDEAVRAGLEEIRLQGLEKHLRDVAETRREAAERASDEARRRFVEADEERARARTERDLKQAALTRSDGLRLASEAMLARPNDPGLSLLLGLEAVRRYPHSLTFNALYDAEADLREQRCVFSAVGSLRFLRTGPGGKVLVGTDLSHGSFGGGAAIYDPRTGKKLAEWQGYGCGLGDLDWDANGVRAVAAINGRAGIDFTDGQKPERATFTDRVAYVWDATTGRDVAHLRGHEDRVVSCRFSQDGSKIVTSSWDETARVWDAATGKELLVLRGHARSLLTALFTPDGRRVLTVSAQTKDTANHRDDAGKPLPDREPNTDPGLPTRPYRSGSWTSGGRSQYSSKPELPLARLWDAGTGELVGTLTDSKGTVGLLDFTNDRPLTAAFSLDGKRIALGFTNDLIGVWDTGAGGDPIHVLRGHGGRVTALAFSPDGKSLATGGDRSAVFLWDLESGRFVRRLEGHDQSTLNSLQFSGDGTRLVSSAADKTARVWEVGTGQMMAVFRGHSGPVGEAHFLGDSDTVITAGDRTVRLWTVRPPLPVATLLGAREPSVFDPLVRLIEGNVSRGHSARIETLTFSPDGRTVLTGGHDYTARLWDAETGRQKAVISEKLRGEVRYAQFDSDGKTVFLGTEMNSLDSGDRGDKETLLSTIHRWDPTKRTAARLLKDQTTGVSHVSLSPDGRRMLVVSSSNGLTFRPTETDPLLYGFVGTVKAGAAAVWSVETGQRSFVLLKDAGFMTIAPPQFSPDGMTILLPDPMRDDLQIVDAGTGAAIRTLPAPKSDRNNRWEIAQFSPDGRTVTARKSGGRFVWFWSTGTGELLGSFEIPDGYAGWEAIGRFSPDSTRYAIVADRLVHIIDVATRTGTQVLRGHEARVYALDFSPDGSRLLTGSDDQSAAIWEVGTGRIYAAYKGHPGPVRHVAYSPDGKRVATASTDTLVRVWPVDVISLFERRSPRSLTAQERERYELPRK